MLLTAQQAEYGPAKKAPIMCSQMLCRYQHASLVLIGSRMPPYLAAAQCLVPYGKSSIEPEEFHNTSKK